ncbi:MAG: response regulator [Anaerolineae bacterium]|nr:response regulator [Anaerolineae bacterium]
MSHYPKVFYVEDDEMSRIVIEILLKESLGLSDVIVFPDSQDFENKIDEFPFIPDIIFLDIHVKPYDGFQMLDILRQHPVFANKPIVALTASVMNEEVDLLKTSGFDGVLAKPINEATFPDQLNRILQGEKIWSIL